MISTAFYILGVYLIIAAAFTGIGCVVGLLATLCTAAEEAARTKRLHNTTLRTHEVAVVSPPVIWTEQERQAWSHDGRVR